MSEEDTPREATPADIPDAQKTAETPPTTEPTDTTETPESKANKEAAKYRKQLRTVEAERDQLRAHLTALQKSEVLRAAAAELADPSDLLTFAGDDLNDYLDDDGNVSADKVLEAARKITETRPGLGHPHRTFAAQGPVGQRPSASENAWTSAFKPRR